MAPVKRILARLAGLFRKSHREREIADEFESHFQMHIEDNLRAGMTLGEARRRTLLKFGGVDSAKEAVRDMSTTLWIENTFRDLRYAVRGLLRTPSFSMTAVLSLALGIGASLAIFAVADSLLLRPLPFRDPNRVVMVWERNIRTKNLHNPISAANYFDWRAQNNVFESMAAFGDGRVVLSYGDRVEELRTRFATAGMLPMLGVKPFRGRFFTEEEDAPKGPDVVVISYRLWQGWFAGDDAIVGRKIQVRSKPATVLGVLPPGFYFLDRNIDVWEPIGFDP
ncbi:MAG TPA: ABC transporter permease, partial [Verrucomicrobiae bacterium]|nr:ABC transporter permease [Verrucomicrobiae bacterium]